MEDRGELDAPEGAVNVAAVPRRGPAPPPAPWEIFPPPWELPKVLAQMDATSFFETLKQFPEGWTVKQVREHVTKFLAAQEQGQPQQQEAAPAAPAAREAPAPSGATNPAPSEELRKKARFA